MFFWGNGYKLSHIYTFRWEHICSSYVKFLTACSLPSPLERMMNLVFSSFWTEEYSASKYQERNKTIQQHERRPWRHANSVCDSQLEACICKRNKSWLGKKVVRHSFVNLKNELKRWKQIINTIRIDKRKKNCLCYCGEKSKNRIHTNSNHLVVTIGLNSTMWKEGNVNIFYKGGRASKYPKKLSY